MQITLLHGVVDVASSVFCCCFVVLGNAVAVDVAAIHVAVAVVVVVVVFVVCYLSNCWSCSC